MTWLGASLVAQLVKNPPSMQETLVRFLGWEDPLEKGTATHSSLLAWRIPWTIARQAPTVHGVLKARILKWFAIPFSSGPHSVRPLHHDPPVLGGPKTI